ncbi:SGNH hydrolase-type esterase domain [Phaffia rhodozyma]|uniref:SGNH hydrolase-type esterase domain n=1 Tax=Phaffia rhodozyma TaxID=264483 RepID=A0A0F7SQ75_PHARH|nr:SGNH hydrolase-type esterase domain [Phaffia rhodozyma]
MLYSAVVPALWASLSLAYSVDAAPLTAHQTSTSDPAAVFNTTMFAPGREPGVYSSNFSRLVMFGDSLSDNGNGTGVLSNGTRPNPDLFWRYRWSNGPVWIEDLAERMDVPLFDYASGGATVNNTRTPAYLTNVTGRVPSALEQIDTFISLTNSSSGRNTLDDTLFAIWIGSNDLFAKIESNISFTGADLIRDTFIGIEKLQAAGAKYFVINNIYDIGRPFIDLMGSEIASVMTNSLIDYNNALDSEVNSQASAVQNATLPTAEFVVVDTWVAAKAILSQPQAYGLANETIGRRCVIGSSICSDPDSYFYWDAIHPTRVVHSLFAKAVAATLLRAGWISRK